MRGTVYFAHGKESGPWGLKIQALARVARARGFAVESPDYSHTQDPDERVRQLLALRPAPAGELVLVGSSMGGYVSAVASRTLRPTGLFLLAPAVYLPGYEDDPSPVCRLLEVVHGWNDDIVPPDNALRFAQRHRARLHMLDSGHTLQDAIPYLERLFGLFLDEVLGLGSPG